MRVGSDIKDGNGNTYKILDKDYQNTHSQYPSHYQVVCVEGYNLGKVRWIMRNTIVNGNFIVENHDG